MIVKRKLLVLAAALALAACSDGEEVDVAGFPGTPTPASRTPTPSGGPGGGQCEDFREGRKNAYFGDLHTHTSYSLDAYFFNAANDPRAAHRFAKGEVGGLPGLGSDDPYTPRREIVIDRPLDFNAVTDHAEFLGGFVNTCGLTPQTQELCDQAIGQGIRDNIVAIAAGDTPLQQQLLQSLVAMSPTNVSAWTATKLVNDEENEPCRYTTLHGYEYSSNELSQMFHRNVIFRGDTARMPLTVFGAVRPDTALNPQNGNDDWDLFDHLNLVCKSVPGCDVLTIPHNPNLSDGRMWLPMEPDTGVPLGRKIDSTDVYFPMTAADAQLRRSLDRAVEITQHKGQSECAVGLEGDYLEGEESACDFEINKSVCRDDSADPATCAQFCTGDPLTDPNFCSHQTEGSNVVDLCVNPGPDGRSRPASDPQADGTGNCTHPLDYYRNAMAEGLAVKRTLGVNPYKANVVAATDTHNGISGNVAERGFVGHGGVLDDEPKEQLGFWACDGGDPADPAQCTNRRFLDFARTLNPGGLAGVWAPENTRNAIWDAIHRGESWGTSGPRIRIRTLGAWALPEDVCDQLSGGTNPVDDGLEGARMGGDLPLPAQGEPKIAIWARQDPEGHPLQRIDVVKGWVDADGKPRVKVFANVAATSVRVERPSITDCSVEVGDHPEELCAVWTDPEFDPAQDAYYYARSLEVPSCRWSAWLCNVDKKVDCGELDPANGMFAEASGFRGYEGCCAIDGEPGSFRGANTFATIEERAWASPIWYEAP